MWVFWDNRKLNGPSKHTDLQLAYPHITINVNRRCQFAFLLPDILARCLQFDCCFGGGSGCGRGGCCSTHFSFVRAIQSEKLNLSLRFIRLWIISEILHQNFDDGRNIRHQKNVYACASMNGYRWRVMLLGTFSCADFLDFETFFFYF